jgi:hypothetical protein
VPVALLSGRPPKRQVRGSRDGERAGRDHPRTVREPEATVETESRATGERPTGVLSA